MPVRSKTPWDAALRTLLDKMEERDPSEGDRERRKKGRRDGGTRGILVRETGREERRGRRDGGTRGVLVRDTGREEEERDGEMEGGGQKSTHLTQQATMCGNTEATVWQFSFCLNSPHFLSSPLHPALLLHPDGPPHPHSLVQYST